MINAGAILICALLKTLVEPQMELAEKFKYIQQWFLVKETDGGADNARFTLTNTFSLDSECRAVNRWDSIKTCFCPKEKQLIAISPLDST